LGAHPNLTQVVCANNNLTLLKVDNGNNLNVSNFNATGNLNLLCVVVDSTEWSDLNWSNIDPQTTFNDTCYYLSVEKNSVRIEAFPNPVSDVFNVLLDEQANFKLHTVNGQIVKEGVLFNGENTILVSEFDPGIYFLIVKTESAESVLKVVIH
jgi:hypothetical protein